MNRHLRTMTARGVAGGREWLRENFQGTVVDIRSLPRQLQWLTIFGYGVVLFFLAAFALMELVGDFLPRVTFELSAFNAEAHSTYTSYVALGLFYLAVVLGWGLAMTGASDCRRRVFLPVFVLYFLMIVLSSSFAHGGGGIATRAQEYDLFVWLLVLIFGALVTLTKRWSFWSRYPLVEFLGWSLLTAAHVSLAWFSSESAVDIADGATQVATFLGLIALPFFFMLGIDAAAAIHEYAFFATQRLQTMVSGRALLWIVPLFLFLEGFIGMLVLGATGNQLAIGAFACAPVLLLALPVLMLTRRWNPRTAAALFWFAIAGLLFGAFLTMALEGWGINDALLGATRLLPPALIFMVLLLYDVATFGTRVASTDGVVMPRSGRLLLYLGAVTLTAGFSLLIFNVTDRQTGGPGGGYQDVLSGVTMMGLLLVGPIYLLRAFWKSRHEMLLTPPAGAGVPEPAAADAP